MMNRLRKNYIAYLKDNPKSFNKLRESCKFLSITKTDIG